MFNAIRRLTNDMRSAVVPIRDKEGKPITSIDGQIHRWKDYLEEILNTSITNMEREELTSIPTELTKSIRTPSKREIVNAIKAMKNGKAAGANNIPAEVLKRTHIFRKIFCFHYFKISGRNRCSLRNGKKEL